MDISVRCTTNIKEKKDPLHEIMAVVEQLVDDDVLLLRVSFKPTPLLRVMSSKGVST